MQLIDVKPEHPLHQRLLELRARLEPELENIRSLKQKFAERLLAWERELHAVRLDGVGTYITTGIRELLQTIFPDMLDECMEIDALGSVNLQLENERIQIAQLRLPPVDEWVRKEFVNKNGTTGGLESFVLVPIRCDEYCDPRKATLDGNGSFELDDKDTRSAKIVMTVDYIRRYIRIARKIRDEEGSVRKYASVMNIDDALDACSWLEENLEMIDTQ